MKKVVSILLMCSGFSCLAGGGWTQKKGSGFVKLGQSAIIANRYFAPSGETVPITTTALYTSSFYLEYGLSDRLTGILYMPFFVRSTLNELQSPNGSVIEAGDELNALGDADLTIKYGLIQDKTYVLSASLTLGLPIGVASGGRTGLLQSGDGELNQMLTLELSRGFTSGIYATTLIGFNNRIKGFSDEFRYGAEVGFVKGRIIPILKIYGVTSLQNGSDLGLANTGVFSNNIEYLAITPELSYQVKETFGLTVGMGTAAFGKRLLAAPNFMIGAYLKW